MIHINSILKRELMIDECKNKQNHKMNGKRCFIKQNNNNNMQLTNQNKNVKSGKNVDLNLIVIKKEKHSPKKQYYTNLQKTKQAKLNTDFLKTFSKYQCDYCKRGFEHKHNLRRHMSFHLDKKSYTCSHCPKKFLYHSNVKIHEKRHHSDVTNESDVYVCDLCEKPFLIKENLVLHITAHQKPKNNYKCVYCDKVFKRHTLLNSHEKHHLISGRYQCTLCTLTYQRRNDLVGHIRSHLEIKNYVCQFCGLRFIRSSSMKRHVRINHAGHRITCPICNKSLRGHLTEHMRTHEKDRPHECPDCGQSFVQSTQLNVHRRSHSGSKPYNCRICGKFFTHSNALMLHIRRHTGEKPFTCPLCPFKFSQLPHMKAHMRNIHGKDNPYKCNKCGQFFKLIAQLDNHINSCKAEDKEITHKKKIKPSAMSEEFQTDTAATLTRMRFLLALLFTMIAPKAKLKFLGFNKRLIDDLLIDSLEAFGKKPCVDDSLTPLECLNTNIQILLDYTVPKYQIEKFQKQNKTTEEILELLTDHKKKIV